MVYDVTMLEAFYAAYKGKVEHVRAILKRPLTLAEKILYAHLYDVADLKDYKRGEDYVNFRPDRVAMQDATAQMALLQFMNAGKDQVAVPSTVHCDHLIQAYKGAKADIATARLTNEEVYDFLRDVSSRYGIGGCDDRNGMGAENAEDYRCPSDRETKRLDLSERCNPEIGRHPYRKRRNECYYRIFWSRNRIPFCYRESYHLQYGCRSWSYYLFIPL